MDELEEFLARWGVQFILIDCAVVVGIGGLDFSATTASYSFASRAPSLSLHQSRWSGGALDALGQ